MPELLLELGMEELPASFVERAFHQLREEICRRLAEARIEHGAAEALGTPRRLIVRVHDVAELQPDQTKEVRGPGLKAAFGPDGAPTPALLGFCRGQGVEVTDLRQDEQYVWATKVEVGKPTLEVLASILPEAIRALTFDKSMRWGSGKMRFARPIRWIVALLGGKPVSFQVETVSSGVESRGHRFNHPGAFAVTGFDQLVSELRARGVEPDPGVRRQRVEASARKVASGEPEMTTALLDENVYLTEWPEALEGEFKPDFMSLPEPVLITAMAKHERFFPVRGPDGKLTNKFISIRNGGEEETVRNGNAWVLNARFNDAKFFFDEDAKSDMAGFLAKTDRMLFQEKLGSVRQRAERLAKLARALAERGSLAESEAEQAEIAGRYAKADLATGLVSELSSLQGVIGGEYARREGFSEEVCHALATQYSPEKAAPSDTSRGRVARCLMAADQLDKLAGYLGLGLAPSGSSDPFGLRRAVTYLIDGALGWAALDASLGWGFDRALELYAEEGHALDAEAARLALREIFLGRYKALMPEARYDLLEAAMLEEHPTAPLHPRQVRFRLMALERLAGDPALVQTATRPLNIVAAAKKKGLDVRAGEWSAAALESEQGAALGAASQAAEPALVKAMASEAADDLADLLRGLAPSINAFFDTTMVMVEDTKVRDARLSLLASVGAQLARAGDWTKIVVE